MSPARPRAARQRASAPAEERIATAVLAVDDVLALSSGPVGQFRSYLPGGASVPGVRIDGERLEVNIVTRYGPRLPELGDRVAAAVRPHLAGQAVVVVVEDIVLPGEPEPDPADSVVELPPEPGTGPDD